MTRRTVGRAGIGLLALGLLGPIAPARAQLGATPGANSLDGFTVEGKGSVAAKPNRLEIDVEVSAASEMSADVIVKYRDAKKRLTEAMANLKMANVSVEERALTVDQKGQAFNPYTMDTPPVRRGKIEVQLTRKLVIRCDKIRDLDEEALLQIVSKLLDVAQDAGAKVGNPGNPAMAYYYGYPMGDNGLIRFILDDFDGVEDKAYQAAVTDARGHATRLAQLNGVELGPVLGVRETLIPGAASPNEPVYNRRGQSEPDQPGAKKQLTTNRFQEIPVRVELQVRYAAGLAKGPQPQGRQGGQP